MTLQCHIASGLPQSQPALSQRCSLHPHCHQEQRLRVVKILPLFADFNIAQSRSVSFWVVMQMVGDHDQLDERAESVVSWRQVRGLA